MIFTSKDCKTVFKELSFNVKVTFAALPAVAVELALIVISPVEGLYVGVPSNNAGLSKDNVPS